MKGQNGNEILDKLDSGGQGGNHTLRWDQVLPAAERFVVLAAFNNEAVLDNETGLVCERSPDTTATTWLNAQLSCNVKAVGGHRGWRLPTIQDLTSLLDPTVFPGPTLPAGHPFRNVQSSVSIYWSVTTNGSNVSFAWFVGFGNDNVGFSNKSSNGFVRCVRGGQGVDPQ
jgi:hypothetical protein